MNEIDELSLSTIMHLLSVKGEEVALIGCCRRFVRVAKKYGLYARLTRHVAANRIARAYRFYRKFGGQTFDDFGGIMISQVQPGFVVPPPISESGLNMQHVNWRDLKCSWLNQQPHVFQNVILPPHWPSTVTVFLPRAFDILRTLVVQSDAEILDISLSLSIPHPSRLTFHHPTGRTPLCCASWELNVPLLLLHLFDRLRLSISFAQNPTRLTIKTRGVFLGQADRNQLLQVESFADYWGAARNCRLVQQQ